MRFVRGQANLQSTGASHWPWKTQKETDRHRVNIVKNRPGMALLQNWLFTSVFSAVLHSAFVPVVNKARLGRQMLLGVSAETKLKDFKALKPEIMQFLYQSPERTGT